MSSRKPSDERQHEIVEAAIKILGARGLRELTAARLAREVGIRDGTIFRHFKDMQEIMRAMLARLESLLLSDTLSVAGDPLANLGDFVGSRIRAIAAQPGLHALIFSDQLTHALGAEGQRRVAAIRNRGREHIRACLRAAIDRGQVRSDVDLEILTLLVNGSVLSVLFAVKDGALPASVEDIAQQTWQSLQALLQKE